MRFEPGLSHTAVRHVPLHRCNLQRHVGVNNLPKVVTRQCGSRELNSQPSSCESNTLTTRLLATCVQNKLAVHKHLPTTAEVTTTGYNAIKMSVVFKDKTQHDD